MENFREKMKIETIITAVLCVILAGLSVLGLVAQAGLVQLTPSAGDEHWQSMWRGLLSGTSFGVMALMIFGLVQSIRALKDEKKLKKLYIEATDERQHQIWTMARASSMQVTLLAGLVVGIAIGYINPTVSITILVLESVHAVVGVLFKLYYSRKF